MKMTTSQRIHEQFVAVMQRIDDVRMMNNGSQNIEYEYITSPRDASLSKSRQRKILQALLECEAIKIIDESSSYMTLEIQPRFDRVYGNHNLEHWKVHGLDLAQLSRTKQAYEPLNGVTFDEQIQIDLGPVPKPPALDYELPQEPRIELVLYSDHCLCLKDNPKQERRYPMRQRSGKPSKRMQILHLVANSKRRFSGEELRQFGGYAKAQTARNEIKRFFNAIATKLDLKYDDLCESDDNGYQVKCLIEIKDYPAP